MAYNALKYLGRTLASSTEATAGTDAKKVVTPLTMQAKFTANKSATETLTNKTLTSPVLNTGVSGTAVLDEDDMASDSATQLATQQSIKAYVDSSIQKATVTVSNSELQALAATPKTLVAAPGASKYIEYLGGTIALIFGTTAIDDAAADGDLIIETGTSNTTVSLTVDADGLVDAAATTVSTAKPLATDVTLDANETLQLKNNGAEYTVTGGGDGTLSVTVFYRILDLS